MPNKPCRTNRPEAPQFHFKILSIAPVGAHLTFCKRISMKPQHLAQILLRVVAIFLVWRALEFGISQYVGFQYQMKIYTPSTDKEVTDIFRSVQLVILLSALIPILLAGLLWWLAPRFAPLVVPDDDALNSKPAQLSVSSYALLQVAGFVFIALALSGLPQIIFSFSTERTQDPTLTVMTSRVFPDALQFLGKILVGGIILIIVKEKTKQRNPRAEQAAS